MLSPERLTKPVTINTNIPSPLAPEEIAWSDSSKEKTEVNPPTIQLKVCSELLQYATAVQYFGGKGQLGVVQDGNGQPVMFSIGTDDQLYCLTHVNGISAGWKMHNISPIKTRIVAFDVFVDSSKKLHIGAATLDSDGMTTVHHALICLPQKDTPDRSKVGGELDLSVIPWTTISDNLGRRQVSYLTIGPRKASDKTQSSILLTVGTSATQNFTATHYTIDPTPGLPNPWKPFEIPRDAGEIMQILPAKLKSGNGVFVLFKQHGCTDCFTTIFDPTTGERSHDLRTLLLKSLGELREICANSNPWGMTDLVVAGEKGVGFVNYANPTGAPVLVDGLQDIRFKQVVCSEAMDQTSNNVQTKLTLFAVSDDDELYFIQGTRQLKGNQVKLFSSGLPIRSNVQRISCQYNATTDTSELIFVTGGGNEVKHLLRDPQTTCWSENTVQFASPTALQQFKAYVTTVSITESTGRSVGKDFPAKIKSESSMVLVNDRSYALSKKATNIRTDHHGQIVIVSAVTDQLDGPVYDLEIDNSGVRFSTKIYAAQRVMGILSNIKDVKSLAAAKSSSGEAIFSQDEISSKKAEFEASANLLSNFSTMLSSVDEDTKQIVPIGSGNSSDIAVCVEKTADGVCTVTDEGWFDKAVRLGKEYVGDALEFLRSMVKKVFKFAFKIVGKVVSFVINIGSKVFSFVVSTVGPLVRAVGNFLRDVLGVDFGQLFSWLGLSFDVSKTKAIQKELIEMVNGIGDMSIRFTKVNRSTLDQGLDSIKAKLEAYIADTRKAPQAANENPRSLLRDSPLAWLFDNPVIKFLMKFNPLSIILEAAGEAFEEGELGEMFQFPSFAALNDILTDTLPRILESQLANLVRLLEDMAEKLQPMIKDPSTTFSVLKDLLQNVFWTLFDAIKLMIQGVWDIMGGIIEQAMEFFKGKWKLPLITSLFEWYAEQDFSLLNVTTFVAAQVIYLIYGDSTWDSIGRPQDITNKLQNVDLDMKPLLGLSKQQSNQSVPTVDALDGKAVFSNSVTSPKYEITKRNLMVSTTENAPPVTLNLLQTAAKKDHHHSSLSTNAQDALKAYHHRRKWCTTSLGLLRSVTVLMEAYHGTTVALASGDAGHHTSRVLPNLMLLTSVSSFAASLTQLALWLEAREHSDEVKQELDHDFDYMLPGHIASTVCSALGAGYHFLGWYHHSKGLPKSAVAAQCTGNMLLSVGAASDVVLVHLIPEWSDTSKGASMLRIVDVMELVATGCGVLTTGMTMVSSQNPVKAKALVQPIMAAGATDGFLSVLTLIMNAIDLSQD